MTPRLRKLVLTVHIACAVGWLGAVAAFLVLGIAGATSHEPEVVRGAYLSMDLISRNAVIPMSFGTLATGLVQALGSPWGLGRYYWIAFKFALAVLATFALLVHQFAVVAAVAAHVSGAPAEVLLGARLDPFKAELVRAPTLALLVLLAALTLAVFKPWGLTRRARRRQQ